MRDEVTGGQRKLYNDEFHNFCSPPNIIRMIESRRMKWVGHEKCKQNFLLESLKEGRDHSEDLGIDIGG
jgi:hypothetical protein